MNADREKKRGKVGLFLFSMVLEKRNKKKTQGQRLRRVLKVLSQA